MTISPDEQKQIRDLLSDLPEARVDAVISAISEAAGDPAQDVMAAPDEVAEFIQKMAVGLAVLWQARLDQEKLATKRAEEARDMALAEALKWREVVETVRRAVAPA